MTGFTIINLTPHAVDMYDKDMNLYHSFPSQSAPAGVVHNERSAGFLPAKTTVGAPVLIPITAKSMGTTSNLPAPVEGTYYIVSQVVARANAGRTDLLVPDVLVVEGKVRGATALSIYLG